MSSAHFPPGDTCHIHTRTNPLSVVGANISFPTIFANFAEFELGNSKDSIYSPFKAPLTYQNGRSLSPPIARADEPSLADRRQPRQFSQSVVACSARRQQPEHRQWQCHKRPPRQTCCWRPTCVGFTAVQRRRRRQRCCSHTFVRQPIVATCTNRRRGYGD